MELETKGKKRRELGNERSRVRRKDLVFGIKSYGYYGFGSLGQTLYVKHSAMGRVVSPAMHWNEVLCAFRLAERFTPQPCHVR